MSRLRVLIPLLLLVVACDGRDRPVAAVAMPDPYAAEVASTVLASGGNAVDAAIASTFSLAVTYPVAGNIGGGGFMLVHFEGEPNFIDYRETAPRDAHRDMYLDGNGNVIEMASLIGHRASGVPGTVAGMWLAHQRYGSLPWADLLAPAIELAREGFVVSAQLEEAAREVVEWHEERIDFESSFGVLTAGEAFRQPDLARTLQRIAEFGVDEFYRGETARLIVEEMRNGDGLITARDLEEYRAVEREPLRADWRGLEILSAPPPSSGGFAVIQLLGMRDHLQSDFEGLAHNSPQYIHLVAEIEKRVFADRAEYLGDPDFYDVPMDDLLDADYLRRRAGAVQANDISTLDAVAPGLESPDTTHFSILDRWGNAVANSYTLNWDFGSGVVVDGAGFLLNDEMDDFSVKPGVPNIFGVVGRTANEIQPGKRMLSSMSPTMLLRDGEVELVIGTPGGSTIFTTVFQVITNIYDFGMTPAEAIGANRFHHQLLPPDLITHSPNIPLPEQTVTNLEDRGYRIEPHFFDFGNVQVILRRDGQIDAASDPRKIGESRVLRAD